MHVHINHVNRETISRKTDPSLSKKKYDIHLTFIDYVTFPRKIILNIEITIKK